MQVISCEDRTGTGHRSNIVFDGTSEVGCVMPLNNTGVDEDRSHIRKGNGAHVMVSLRNLVKNIFFP